MWHGITSRYETSAPTATNSFADHLDRVTRKHRERLLPARPLAGQRGVIIGIGGRVLGMELLATPTALATRWTGIVEAARFDADGVQEAATQGQRARDFAVTVEQTRITVARESNSTLALEADRAALHLSGIALPEPERSIDGDFWRVVHLAAYDRAHPLLVGA